MGEKTLLLGVLKELAGKCGRESKRLELNFTDYKMLTLSAWKEFCIKHFKTKIRIFWCCPRAFKANILVLQQTQAVISVSFSVEISTELYRVYWVST